MIGKPVSGDELKAVLNRQAERDEFVKQLEEELKAIKPGECLLYESNPQSPLWADIGLALLLDRVKGLETIKEPRHIYVYRRK